MLLTAVAVSSRVPRVGARLKNYMRILGAEVVPTVDFTILIVRSDLKIGSHADDDLNSVLKVLY